MLRLPLSSAPVHKVSVQPMSLSDDDSGEVQFCRSIRNVRRRAHLLAIDSDEENTPPAAVAKLHSTLAPAQGLFTVRNGTCPLSFAGAGHKRSQQEPFNAAGQEHSGNCNRLNNNSPWQALTRPAASKDIFWPACNSAAHNPSSCDGAEAETSPSPKSQPQPCCSRPAPVPAQAAAGLPGTPCNANLQVTAAGAAAVAAADEFASPCTPNMPGTPTAAPLDIDDPFTPWLCTARKQGRSAVPGSSNNRQQPACDVSSPMSISSSSSMASWQQDPAQADVVAAALLPPDPAPAAAKQIHVAAAATASPRGSAKDDLAASAAAPATERQAAVGWASAAAAAIPACNQHSPVQALLQPFGQSTGMTPAGAAVFCIDSGPVWTPEAVNGPVNLLTQLSAALSLTCSSIDSPADAQAVTPVPFQSQSEPMNESTSQAKAAARRPEAGATATPASGSIDMSMRCASGNLGKQPGHQAAQNQASLAAAHTDVAAAAAEMCLPAATVAAVEEASAVQVKLHETADLTASRGATDGTLYSSDSDDDEDIQLTFQRRRPSKEATKTPLHQQADEYVAAAVAGIGNLAVTDQQASAASVPVLNTLADLTAITAAAGGTLYSSDDDDEHLPAIVMRSRFPVAGAAVTGVRDEADAATDSHTSCSGTFAAEDRKHLTVFQAEDSNPIDESTHQGLSIRGGDGSSAGRGGSIDSSGKRMQLIHQTKQYAQRGVEQVVPQHKRPGSSKGNSSSTHCGGSSSSDDDDDQPVIFSRRRPFTPAHQTAAKRDLGNGNRSNSSHSSSRGGDSDWSTDSDSDDREGSSSDFSFTMSKRNIDIQKHTSSITQQATQQIATGCVTPQACPGRITPGSSSSLVARRRKRRGTNEHAAVEAAAHTSQQQQQRPRCQQGENDRKSAGSTPPPAAAAAGCDPYDFEAVMAALTPPNTISACVKTPGMAVAYNSSCGLTPRAGMLPFTPAAAAAPSTCANLGAAAGPAAATAAPAGARRLSFGLSPFSPPVLKPQALFGVAAAATSTAGRSVLNPISLVSSTSVMTAAPAGSLNTTVGPAGGKGTGRKRQQQPLGAATAPAKAPTSRVFARQRQQLAQQLYDHWNAQVFDGALPAQLPLVWNTRLTSTAGQVVDDGSQNLRKTSRDERIPVRLELSTKVLDTEVRLRTTLGHEMCHVAAWAISKEFKQHHGPAFWMWAKRFEDRIDGIKITTCHNYEIHAPFRWQCMNTECGKQYHRHKCSIDPNKHVCSRCNGRLMFLGKFSRDGKVLSTARSGGVTPGAATKTPGAGGNVFSQFVKTHFASIKKEMPAGTPHKELMSRLAGQYKQQKTAVKTQQPQQQQIEKQQDLQQQKEQHPQRQQQSLGKCLVDDASKVDCSSTGRQVEFIELASDSDSGTDTQQQQQQQLSQLLDVDEASLLSFMKRLDLAE